MSVIEYIPPTHIMVDTETYDTAPTAVILSIGACVVTDVEKSFYAEIDPYTQFERTQSLATVQWWNEQGNCPNQGTVQLAPALCQLAEWIRSVTLNPIIWCKGTDFDTVILSNAYRQYHLEVPWKYNAVRDWRTVKKLFPNLVDEGIVNTDAHNALADAVYQAKQLSSTHLNLK